MPESGPPISPLPEDARVDASLPIATPDLIEQENENDLDPLSGLPPSLSFPIVGLGGSAGGLRALQSFFEAVQSASGMAYVVVMHLSPHHESRLPELLASWTSLSVQQVTSRTKVLPDHVYVIPPGKHLSITDGHLILTKINRDAGKPIAVDLFFRTLADVHGPRAAVVVFSGADGDGATGLKRVKERGGLAIAQNPIEAEYDGMPRAAIGTGLVDWVLNAAEIPAKLVAYWRAEQKIRLPLDAQIDADAASSQQAAPAQTDDEAALRDIVSLLRVRTGHDFAGYKRATVLRRIARRMQVQDLAEPASYLEFLRTHPEEPQALLKDLLISVTNFFRDREAFAALAGTIPALFQGKTTGDTVRVWVAACATGEEAYSVAMLLAEHADTLDERPMLQVFATDLDETALQSARDGFYPEAIVADVDHDRLRRFFVKEHGGYRVRRDLREIVLFALHDLLKDTPFSRLDLVTCRNLLIYLNREAQTRTLDIFHFSLRPEGMLFLGTSESVDEGNPYFSTLDKKRRLFVRQSVPRTPPPLLRGPVTFGRSHVIPSPAGNLKRGKTGARETKRDGQHNAASGNWSDVHYDFLEQLSPPSVLVDRDYNIIHLSEHAGRYLQVGGGGVTTEIIRMVQPTLQVGLRAALHRATYSGATATTPNLPFTTPDGMTKNVALHVTPSRTNANLLLVVFREDWSAANTAPAPATSTSNDNTVVSDLAQELDKHRLLLRETIEQSDAASEELRASNEELQAVNEELRSTTEELETGREELQSTNEELNTVNQELKSKVDELGRAYGDLQNLMASTQIATIFLDRQLCIQRYTPPAVALFNLIPSDIGRPLSDLAARLEYPKLASDAERVLNDLATAEVEVGHRDGRWFLARILPYRTTNDAIAGVVMTFVDITRRRQAENELRDSEARFRAVADLVPDLLFRADADGKLLWCNQRWLDFTGQTLERVQGDGWLEIVHPDDRQKVHQAFKQSVDTGEIYRSEHRLTGGAGISRWFLVRAEPFRDATGKIVQWFGAKTDIDDFKRTSANLVRSEDQLQLILDSAREFAIISADLSARITTWNPGAERFLGYSKIEILGQQVEVIFTPEDRAANVPRKEMEGAMRDGRASDERWHERKDGSRFWASGAMMRMNDAEGEAVGFVKILRDETEARDSREKLEKSREELMLALQENEHARAEAVAAGQAKDRFLAVLSHELRTPLTPVVMAVHTLRRRVDLPAPAREALEMIERNVQIEAHLIDDLLDLTRVAHGKLEIIRETVDLHEAVRQAVEISADDVRSHRQTLTVKLDAKNYLVRGDFKRLQQVFWNLLKNSSKFTPEGGSIHIRSSNASGRVAVEITDTGIGFGPEAAEGIFDSFTQGHAEITRKYGGLGLGLAIAKATVEAHDGTLVARSEGQDRGATFVAYLPIMVPS